MIFQAFSNFTARKRNFAKVMFLHVSVCPQGAGAVPGQVPPRQVHPQAGTPPQAGAPPWAGTPPPARYTPWAGTSPPGAVHAGRYGQQAGVTHPTGMHSC